MFLDIKKQTVMTLSIVLIISLSACKAEAIVTPIVSPTSVVELADNLPNYLDAIWPPPYSQLSSNWYKDSLASSFLRVNETGIGVILLTDQVAEEGDFDVNWVERCSLVVDGVVVAQDTLLVENGIVLSEGRDADGKVLFRVSGPYYLAWRMPLEPGKHQVIFNVRRTSGIVFEYNWQFTLD